MLLLLLGPLVIRKSAPYLCALRLPMIFFRADQPTADGSVGVRNKKEQFRILSSDSGLRTDFPDPTPDMILSNRNRFEKAKPDITPFYFDPILGLKASAPRLLARARQGQPFKLSAYGKLCYI